MEVVILCGGTGTRLREITDTIPKPLIPIGPLPLVRHIMNHYMHYGHDNFILALGYKQEVFKQYFIHANAIEQDITLVRGGGIIPADSGLGYQIQLINTGEKTNKATRLYKLKNYIKGRIFLLTYGDGLSTVSIENVIQFHKRQHNALVTLTGIHPQSKFGEITHQDGRVTSFEEKPEMNGHLVNGGFMVVQREFLDYLPPDNEFELEDIFKALIKEQRLYVYHHTGFWKNADTLKDIGELQEMWDLGEAPWLL